MAVFPSRTWMDIALTALAPAIWGSTYLVTTEVLPPDRPFTSALLRVLPAGLLLVVYSRKWPARGEWGRLALLSSLNIAAFQALLFVAAYRMPGGLAAVLGAIQPLLVMLLAWVVERRRPSLLLWAAGVIGMLGMAALLLSPGAQWDPWGAAAALAGAACMAAGTYFSRRWPLTLPVLPFTGWQLLLGGVMLAPAAWGLDPALPLLSVAQGLGYAYLSLGGALVAYVLWFRGIARLAPAAVSSLSLLSPLVAVGLGWAWLGQSVTEGALVGLVMVLGSVLAVQWGSSRQVVSSEEPSSAQSCSAHH